MASKGPLDDSLNRSSVEVEEILPCAEHGPNPRDFYTCDSPVLDEYHDPGHDSNKSAEEFLDCLNPEDKADNQAERSTAYHV
jgi:hypothetical protein